MKSAKIALIGDLHGAWDDWDVEYFDRSDYDYLLFTGDLGSGTGAAGVQVARSIARLGKPVFLVPGNNDVEYQPEIEAEFSHQQGLIRILEAGGGDRSSTMSRSVGQVEVCGFSRHLLQFPSGNVTLVAGRPHSMGGASLSFEEHLTRNYGVSSLSESAERLVELVDQAPTDELLFLSHNGPHGL
ncbi:metallophosphoesterase, partial [Myxococcota bacterium]|nr:metallophosphoesterase [Myxococcota bacterium]